MIFLFLISKVYLGLVLILIHLILASCLSETEDGPWKMVLQTTLDDSRKQTDPLPLQEFSIPSTQGRFVKFELMSYYGRGGGLQYFNINKNGPKVVKEKSSSYPHPNDIYSVQNLLTRSRKKEERGNYWVLPDKATGQGFMLDFDTVKKFNFVQLVNTHNAESRDRSTKQFKILLRCIILHVLVSVNLF